MFYEGMVSDVIVARVFSRNRTDCGTSPIETWWQRWQCLLYVLITATVDERVTYLTEKLSLNFSPHAWNLAERQRIVLPHWLYCTRTYTYTRASGALAELSAPQCVTTSDLAYMSVTIHVHVHGPRQNSSDWQANCGSSALTWWTAPERVSAEGATTSWGIILTGSLPNVWWRSRAAWGATLAGFCRRNFNKYDE